MNKIYAWINSVPLSNCLQVEAIADDGHWIASHISSDEEWAKSDIGVTSKRKHDIYNEHFPNGWEIEWIGKEHIFSHPGLLAALEKNKVEQAKRVLKEVDNSRGDLDR